MCRTMPFHVKAMACRGRTEDKLYLNKMIYVVNIPRLDFFTFSKLSGEEEARACEEGADSQSQDLRAQCEEEGMTEECEEEERC